MEELDQVVDDLLDAVITLGKRSEEKKEFDKAAHHALARKAAAESAVLLKNANHILPLKPGTKVALIGDFAVEPRYQGAEDNMDNGIVEIGTAIIALLGAVITYIVVPYIKSKTTEQQQKNLAFWVKAAISAAEQIYADPKMGEQKKTYVLEFIQKLGIVISEEELDTLIEAAVLELNKIKQ